ncbi:hypothetical protein HKX48_000418, partial [Thoreauomyces humboldtii]
YHLPPQNLGLGRNPCQRSLGRKPSKNGDYDDVIPISTTYGDGAWGQGKLFNGDAPAAPAAETRKPKYTGFDKQVKVAPAGEHHWLASGKNCEEGLRDTDLEQQLHKADRVPTGLHSEEIQKVRVGIRGGKPPQILQSLNTLTSNMEYKTPTPIQSAAIPIFLGGRDVMATAQTVKKRQHTSFPSLDILFESVTGLTLIFVNHVRTVDTLDDALFNMGFPITSIHSLHTQEERESSISAFRSNKMPLIVSTDVSARGLESVGDVVCIQYAQKD